MEPNKVITAQPNRISDVDHTLLDINLTDSQQDIIKTIVEKISHYSTLEKDLILANKMDGKSLLLLQEEHLKEMGIKAIGGKVYLFQLLNLLKKKVTEVESPSPIWRGETPYGGWEYSKDIFDVIKRYVMPCFSDTTYWEVSDEGLYYKTTPACDSCFGSAVTEFIDYTFFKDIELKEESFCCFNRYELEISVVRDLQETTSTPRRSKCATRHTIVHPQAPMIEKMLRSAWNTAKNAKTDLIMDLYQSIIKQNYEPIQNLKLGAFGAVMLAKDKNRHQKCTVKLLKHDTTTSGERKYHPKTGRHPFLLDLIHSFQTDDNKLVFVMTYVKGGELYDYLSRDKVFTEERSRFYAAEIAMALQHLHAHELVYKQLQLESVIVEDDGHIKLTDFSFIEQEIELKTDFTEQTPVYLAPEVLESRSYGFASDWWAFGVVLFTMLCGRLPFYAHGHDKMRELILAGELNFLSTVSDTSKAILNSLLEKVPDNRLGSGGSGAGDVMQHKFFESINWIDVHNKRLTPSFVPLQSR